MIPKEEKEINLEYVKSYQLVSFGKMENLPKILNFIFLSAATRGPS